MVKALDGGIVVSQVELQSHYYVHFRANTLGKGMNPLILPGTGKNSNTITKNPNQTKKYLIVKYNDNLFVHQNYTKLYQNLWI